jgi:hypothetical protein
MPPTLKAVYYRSGIFILETAYNLPEGSENDLHDPIKQKNIIKFLYKIVFWIYSILSCIVTLFLQNGEHNYVS